MIFVQGIKMADLMKEKANLSNATIRLYRVEVANEIYERIATNHVIHLERLFNSL